MKNFIIMCLVALSTTLSAQFNLSLTAEYGGNYAVVNEDPLTGINSSLRLGVIYELEEDFGLETSLSVGYSSLAGTYRSTVGQVSFGFTDNQFISGGAVVEVMDKNDALSAGAYVQLRFAITEKIEIIGRTSLLTNVLELDNNPAHLQGSFGVRYNLN